MYDSKGFKAEDLAGDEYSKLINATYKNLAKAVDKGITQDISPEIKYALEKNTYIFSGFKTAKELREASALMVDTNGGYKPFNSYLKDIQTINSTYNENYLKSEYNYAVQSSQMAGKWKEFEKDGDDYNLQYRTANDDKVRDSHQVLDKTTLPMSDKFWDQYYPPLGWNCRCDVVQVRKTKFEISDSDAAVKLGEMATENPKQQIFRFNRGKTLQVFPPKHPYLPKGCGNCEKNLRLAYDANNEQCRACKAIAKCMKVFIKDKNECYTQAVDYGKQNIIGKYTYSNDAFKGKTALFVRNSFTENLKKNDLLFAKIDVLTNIKDYLTQNLKFTKEDPTHNKDKLNAFYKCIVDYKGDIPEGKGRKIELQFKEGKNNQIEFYFIKFL